MQKNETLTFKLAKPMIAVSWADGKIDDSEVNALKELLFSLPELDAREWAELEIYMDSPVDESERGMLLEDVLAALRSASEKNQVLQTIEDLIAIDGNVSEEEKTVFSELKAAIESKQTGVLGLFSQLTGGVLKKKREKGKVIFAERDRKLAEARDKRKARRKEARKLLTSSNCQGCEAPEGLGLDSHKNILCQRGLKITAISD